MLPFQTLEAAILRAVEIGNATPACPPRLPRANKILYELSVEPEPTDLFLAIKDLESLVSLAQNVRHLFSDVVK